MNDEKGKQITYHLSAKYRNEVCEFANILEKAPARCFYSRDLFVAHKVS